MPAGRPCLICADSENAKLVAKMIAEGASDQVRESAGQRLSRMAVSDVLGPLNPAR